MISAGDVQRTTVLVLDASNSMLQGGKFTAAQEAVDTFLEAAPADVRIGLVTFAGDIGEVIEPTVDHDSVRAALAEIELRKGTSVYDGIGEGLDLVGTEGSRSLLVLSDGGDTNSATTLDVVTTDAQDEGVVVDVVSLANPKNAATMSDLADSTGGQVIPAEQGALGAVFSAQADALAQQLLVTFDRPEDAADEVNLGVTVDAGGTSFTDSAFVSIGAAASAPDIVKSGKSLVGTPGMLGGRPRPRPRSRRGPRRRHRRPQQVVRRPPPRCLLRREDRRQGQVERQRRPPGLGRRAHRQGGLGRPGDAHVAAPCRRRLGAHRGRVVAAARRHRHRRSPSSGSSSTDPVFAVLGLVLGVVGPWLYLKFRHSRRLSKFNGQLAETLGLMAGGLQAGLSLPQAVDSVVREGSEPMAGELQRALIEQRLGVDITDALEGVGQRMDSADFDWIVMAIRIQREVGGNLAEILHTVADTLREREYLRRQVKALSAEGRLSGYILTGLTAHSSAST